MIWSRSRNSDVFPSRNTDERGVFMESARTKVPDGPCVQSWAVCVCCVCYSPSLVSVAGLLGCRQFSFRLSCWCTGLLWQRAEEESLWCLKLYLLYLYFTENTCSSEHVKKGLLFDWNYFNFSHNCLHLWYSDVINGQSKCRNWSSTQFVLRKLHHSTSNIHHMISL